MGCFDALSRCSWLGSDSEIKLTGPPARAASPGDGAHVSRRALSVPRRAAGRANPGASGGSDPKHIAPAFSAPILRRVRARGVAPRRAHARTRGAASAQWVGGRRPWFVPRPAGRRCGDVRVPAPPDRMEPFGARTAVRLCAGGRLVSHQITGRCQLIKSCCSLVRALGPAG